MAPSGDRITDRPRGASAWRSWRLFATILVTASLVGHIALVMNLLRPADLWSENPFYRVDYALVYAQAVEGVNYLPRLATWGYNPHLLAGFPTLGNPGINWLPLLMKLCSFLHPAQTYKLYVVATFLIAPVLPALAIRSLGTGRILEPAIGLSLAVAYWQLDHFCYLFRWYGGFAFLFASFLVPLLLQAVAWLAASPGLRRTALAGLALALGLSLHATAFVTVALGLLGASVYLLVRRRIKDLLLVIVSCVIAVLPNLRWLEPFVRLAEYRDPMLLFGQTHGTDPINDLYLQSGRGILVALVLLAPLGLLATWRAGRSLEATIHGTALAGTLVVAFAGSSLGLASIEPGRLLIPLGAASILPATAGLVWSARQLVRLIALILAIAVISAGPFFVTPDYNPVERDLLIGNLNTSERPLADDLVSWLHRNTQPTARVAFEDGEPPSTAVFSANLLALLQQRSGREFLNAPYNFLPLVHRQVQFAGGMLAGRPVGELDESELGELCDRYNVGWLVATSVPTRAALDANELVTPRADMAGARLYEVHRNHSFFLEGSGDVDADYDRISVRGASDGHLVLKYHWFAGLESEPPLRVSRYPVPGDPVGFIRVENGSVRDFTLRNSW